MQVDRSNSYQPCHVALSGLIVNAPSLRLLRQSPSSAAKASAESLRPFAVCSVYFDGQSFGRAPVHRVLYSSSYFRISAHFASATSPRACL